MALLFWDGLDSYNNMTEFANARGVNSYFASGFGQAFTSAFSKTGGRFNKGCIQGDVYVGTGLISITSTSELYSGRAMYLTGNGDVIGFYGTTGSTTYEVYATASGGVVYAYNGQGTLLGQSAASAFAYNAWNWVEARAKISSTTSTNDGIIEVWINNNKVLSNTACITKFTSGSTGFGGVSMHPYGSGWAVDDYYILDTTGASPWNTRLGDCRIATITVNSDKGPNQGTVASGNSNHYVAVADAPYNSTDYISLPASSSGSGEIFGVSALPSTNTFSVLASAIVVVARKTDAGNAAFKLSIKPGANTYNSNTQFLATTNTFFRQEWTTNPNTSSQWTFNEVANANVGFYVV